MSRRALIWSALAVVVVGLSACQAGPPEVEDGEYRFFASSESAQHPDATLRVKGESVTLSVDDVESVTTLARGDEEYTICPDSRDGRPQTLTNPVALGDTHFAAPAVFGDCGVTKPARVTLVDLDSIDDDGSLPAFTRWAEFCDVTDPDC